MTKIQKLSTRTGARIATKFNTVNLSKQYADDYARQAGEVDNTGARLACHQNRGYRVIRMVDGAMLGEHVADVVRAGEHRTGEIDEQFRLDALFATHKLANHYLWREAEYRAAAELREWGIPVVGYCHYSTGMHEALIDWYSDMRDYYRAMHNALKHDRDFTAERPAYPDTEAYVANTVTEDKLFKQALGNDRLGAGDDTTTSDQAVACLAG